MSYYKNYEDEETQTSPENMEESYGSDEDYDRDQENADILDSLFEDDENGGLSEEEEGEAEQDYAAEAPEARQSQEGTTVITKGTIINGSIISDCSLDVMGTINGDIECLGKLSISGKVTGNSMASEVFVDTDRLEGSINSEGCVKIAQKTVVIGDVTASSGVIAGAVRGAVDISGPVVIDSTAVIQGDIKAMSVQVNNGAVLDGHVSLSYATGVDIDTVFEAK